MSTGTDKCDDLLWVITRRPLFRIFLSSHIIRRSNPIRLSPGHSMIPDCYHKHHDGCLLLEDRRLGIHLFSGFKQARAA